ncbi:hypothetical protein MMC17_005970 [Xylographa soralifera]|nr:hypothetical protein [Xylographa soralifera]
MPRLRTYSLEEVLNFRVEDIQGPNFLDVKVKGWHKLTSEQREGCILKLRYRSPPFISAQLGLAYSTRNLVRHRAEIAQSTAVDASALEDRLNQVSRSRSATPILPPFDFNAPEFLEEHIRMEREAHEALLAENGCPCYPIELGFEVFDHPGQYGDIFEYWRGESAFDKQSRLMFTRQLARWMRFREYEQKSRRYFVFHSRFPEFQQNVLERRRRHGLDGDVQLLEKRDEQSKLDDWMEYQDYELRVYEGFEKDLKETQERLASRRKILAEAGLPAFEGIQELEFAKYYGLAMEYDGKEAKAEKKEKLAEGRLRLVEKKLKVAESDDLGETVERATWMGLFLKEVEYVQTQLDELQRLAEDAKRELKPYKEWFQARQIAWGGVRVEDWEEAQRMAAIECKSAEHKEQFQKLQELTTKSHHAGSARFRAKEEMEFAKEGYHNAQLDSFGETVKRTILIKLVQEEVRSAQTQLEQAREPREKITLQREVISALSSISVTKGKIKRHNVLLAWIEQQRREITSGHADSEKAGGQGRSKRANSRVLRGNPATGASRLNKSILGPVNPPKVSKTPRQPLYSGSNQAEHVDHCDMKYLLYDDPDTSSKGFTCYFEDEFGWSDIDDEVEEGYDQDQVRHPKYSQGQLEPKQEVLESVVY